MKERMIKTLKVQYEYEKLGKKGKILPVGDRQMWNRGKEVI